LTYPSRAAVRIGNRQYIVGLEAGCVPKRVEACNGVVEPTVAADVECSAFNSSDSHFAKFEEFVRTSPNVVATTPSGCEYNHAAFARSWIASVTSLGTHRCRELCPAPGRSSCFRITALAIASLPINGQLDAVTS
jgi:hypothetical protein